MNAPLMAPNRVDERWLKEAFCWAKATTGMPGNAILERASGGWTIRNMPFPGVPRGKYEEAIGALHKGWNQPVTNREMYWWLYGVIYTVRTQVDRLLPSTEQPHPLTSHLAGCVWGVLLKTGVWVYDTATDQRQVIDAVADLYFAGATIDESTYHLALDRLVDTAHGRNDDANDELD